MSEENKKNSLSERQFVIYGLNYVVGFGFIATISHVISQGVWGVLVFILTSLITLAVIFAYARAGQKYQNEVGGSYAYAKKTFKNWLVFFQGWNQVSQIMLFSATTPLFFSNLLTSFDSERKWVYVVISLVVYIGLILTGAFGFRLSKWVVFLTAIFKWLTLIIGFGLIIYLISSSKSYGETFQSVAPFSILTFSGSVLSFIYSYGGFESLATISKNVETKRFKKVMILIFLIVISSYFLFYIIFLGLGKQYISDFGLESVYKVLWGSAGASLFTIGLAFNRMSGAISYVQPNARFISPLAEDGFLPACLAKKNKYNEYQNAIYLSVFIAIFSSLVFTIIPEILGIKNSFNTILKAGNISFLVNYLLCIFTVLVWKWRNNEDIPLWETIIYILGMITILFTLIFSQLPFIGSEKLYFEQFVPLISYVFTILVGYFVKFIVKKLEKPKKPKKNS
ncbi:APC family permease [Mycoplasma flocculare]|uniref:APC family permease n=1 Tax=Mesomycoplasma flocculare TaxID=2128 RepID=UPI00136C37C5|nr:APC family permease [Mesomycoplasma flocculare]MXR05701.1 APC family permease [Mesomycoplasma flocculare]MXR12071.1 APC family permease [Mesomycoplasma flocculare]MXR39287.1 APC family permease [Mycoplasma sp. MF12]MXR55924.1 APC family permease [Mesomycoplasma flocculare]